MTVLKTLFCLCGGSHARPRLGSASPASSFLRPSTSLLPELGRRSRQHLASAYVSGLAVYLAIHYLSLSPFFRVVSADGLR